MESNDVVLNTAVQPVIEEEFLNNDNNNNKPHLIVDDYHEIKALKQPIHSSTSRLADSPSNLNNHNDLDNEESTSSLEKSLSNSSNHSNNGDHASNSGLADTSKNEQNSTKQKVAQNKFLAFSSNKKINSSNSSRSPSPNTRSASSLSPSQELKQQQTVSQLISFLTSTTNDIQQQHSSSHQQKQISDISKLLDASTKFSQIISSLDNPAATNLLLNSINKIDLIKNAQHENSTTTASQLTTTPSSLSPTSSSSSSSSLSSSTPSNKVLSNSNLTELIHQQVTPLLESMNLTTNNISANNVTNLNAIRHQIVAAAAQLAAQQQHKQLIDRNLKTKQDLEQTAKNFNNKTVFLNSNNSNVSPSSPTISQQHQQKLSPTNPNWTTKQSNENQLSKQSSSSSQNNKLSQQQLLTNFQLSNSNSQAAAAAAAWTNALNAASIQSANTCNNTLLQQQQQQILQMQRANSNQNSTNSSNHTNSSNLLRTYNNQVVQQLNQQKSTSCSSKFGSSISQSQPPTTQANTSNTNTAPSTMQQALNSIYSPILQKATVSASNTNNSANNDVSSNQIDLSMLNSQLLDLIRQDPSQLDHILKHKSFYQMNDETASFIEGLQLDQTVPANLAAVAAAAAAAAAANMAGSQSSTSSASTNVSVAVNSVPNGSNINNRNNSPRSVLNYQTFAQQQLAINNQQQQFHQLQQHQQSYHHNSNQNNSHPHSNNSKFNQAIYPSNQFSLNQQHIHQSYMQMSLQQQQLNQFQDYHEERFSRKVFVGGLPPDIDEDEIITHFRRYGNLIVDWPHKAESKSYFPPKGYAFLIFQEERSVQDLIETCVMDEGKLYMVVSSPSMKDKPVQIRPWCLGDSDYVMDGSQPLDPRKTIFVGGVPRPLKAIELAMIMDRFYGGVCYAGIDTDPELKYPKGAGRVAFSNQQSYIAAISARFVQLQHGEIDKRVEVKPYVLDDQMCDECNGNRCGGKFAPFFCANVTCLQYYCEACWASIHTRAGREYHKPLVKEGADRPRPIAYK